MPDIVLDGVTKRFRRHCVVDDVSVTLKSGEISGLRGVNGSGKTMLLRLICGLIYPTEGTVQIGGKVLGRDMTFPESIGVLIENPAFLDGYSGRENLRQLASIRGVIDDKRVDEVLELVGLSENAGKKYKKYSLGMKQRLGIAAAIMERPDIVLLDEPTNALDDSGVALARDILLAEKARGATVVVACHDFTFLRAVADTVYCLDAGKITESYTAEALSARLREEAGI